MLIPSPFLLLAGGFVVGYLVGLLHRSKATASDQRHSEAEERAYWEAGAVLARLERDKVRAENKRLLEEMIQEIYDEH